MAAVLGIVMMYMITPFGVVSLPCKWPWVQRLCVESLEQAGCEKAYCCVIIRKLLEATSPLFFQSLCLRDRHRLQQEQLCPCSLYISKGMADYSVFFLQSTKTNTQAMSWAAANSPVRRLVDVRPAQINREPDYRQFKRPSKSIDPSAEFPVNFPIQRMPDNIVIPEGQVSLIPALSSIVTKRYATSVDERNFLTVYEYMVNNQWVIWDYYTGYVHLTGLWKAIGNAKADIVRLVDNSPDLEPVIRRVRGGFLKIQGTWVPFPVARALASRTCYHIRFALIPVFGPSFPDSCLKPHEPGFGQLQLNTTENTRKRRKRPLDTPSSMPKNNTSERSPGPDMSPQKRRRSELVLPTSPTFPRHRHSRSIGSIDTQDVVAARVVPRLTKASHSWSSDSHAIESSSASSSDDEYENHWTVRRRSDGSGPPPMPVKIAFSDETDVLDSPDEFLAVLQATRSLQQLSAGSAGRRWSFDSANFGGGFECGGKLWKWDGKEQLNIVGRTIPARRVEGKPTSSHIHRRALPVAALSQARSSLLADAVVTHDSRARIVIPKPIAPKAPNISSSHLHGLVSMYAAPRVLPADAGVWRAVDPNAKDVGPRNVMDINGLIS
jgi:hypothetical protein